MSMRTIARSSSNRKSASARASSVLPTPVGPRNRNEPIGPVRVGEPGAGAADRVGDRGDGLVLTDDTRVQRVLHADELGHLALHQAADGDPGPLGDDLGDVLLVDLLLEHRLVGLQLVEPRRLRPRCRPRARASSRSGAAQPLELALALGPLGLRARGLEPLLDLADLGDRVLLVLPAGDHRVALLRELRPAPPRWRRGAAARRRRRAGSSTSSASAVFSISSWRMRRSTTSISNGIESISMRRRDAASSTRSIALSGSWRPVM